MKKKIIKMSSEVLVKKYVSTLQHFIEDSGYDLRVELDDKNKKTFFLSKEEANHLIANTYGFLIRKGDCIGKGEIGPRVNLLASYWKARCQEEMEESNRLYDIIKKAHAQI